MTILESGDCAMNPEQRKIWSDGHKTLTGLLKRPEEHENAVALFLRLHASLYASNGEHPEQPTYEDELLKDIREQTLRSYPVHTPGSKNSIVWHLWHSARIEDITMNILAAGSGQVLHEAHFADKLQTVYLHSGNGMTDEEISGFSSSVHIESLFEYRRAVAGRTRSILPSLSSEQLRAKLSPARIRRISEEGAVKDTEQWLIDYWGNKNIAGLVLMPATRHNFIHLNKAMRVKLKLQK
ncbi:DinB family protein [Paenibacillus sp. FSL H7-0357]|uniref:DinB family protein n=2 Tax=Paenibacillus TaxID=44249 RepID=UPI0030D577FF